MIRYGAVKFVNGVEMWVGAFDSFHEAFCAIPTGTSGYVNITKQDGLGGEVLSSHPVLSDREWDRMKANRDNVSAGLPHHPI